MRNRGAALGLVLALACGAPSWAQPASFAPLAREVYGLDLSGLNGDSLPYLLKAQEAAERLGNGGEPGANKLVRYIVLLRQLAQLQDTRLVELRTADGRLIGSDRRAEAERVRRALVELEATGRISPSAPRTEAPGPPSASGGLRDLLNREVSFIEFNKRVLGMAADPATPKLESLRFLSIVSANMDEFFEIRVAGLREEVAAGRTAARADGYAPEETLERVIREAKALVADQYRLLNEEVLPALKRAGIGLDTGRDRGWARRIFREEVRPHLRAIELTNSGELPRVSSKSLNMLIGFADGGRAVVQVPGNLPSAFRAPGAEGRFVLTSTLIREHVAELFPGRQVRTAAPFRVTRNNDLWGREGVARRYGDPVRLEMPSSSDVGSRSYLTRALGLGSGDVYTVDGPVDLGRLGELTKVDRPDLSYASHTAIAHEGLATDPFGTIRRGDVLLHHPFHSYDGVVDVLKHAASDPAVKTIKQTLYRIGGPDSSVAEALIAAAENGKDVRVLVETRARFDEPNNVETIRRLRAAGAKVVYGPPGLKTHSKMLSIGRMEDGVLRRYTHMGSGNYNPGSARFYTDFSMLSADPALGSDVDRLFDRLAEGRVAEGPLEGLTRVLDAPYSLKATLLERIRAEAENAKAGRPARIRAKMNSLNDPELIRALYEASQAGVKIDLVVRGISTLRPGVPGLSENIRLRSVVGRFLEHTRVVEFLDGGNKVVYVGSADWMVRNTERRVETAVSVNDPKLKAELGRVLDAYMADNVGAWELRSDGSYGRVRRGVRRARDAMAELVAGEGAAPADRLAEYRRVDGTLDWGKLTGRGAVREGVGVLHFGLALFLKELAVVVATGDRLRIEEFFDGLMTTEFYEQYGLFVAGARLGELAYTKFLQRYVRPNFVSSLLKTNAVLAAGLALPMIVEGRFSGRVFAVSLGSLGLSSAAVKSGVAALSWVMDLKTARKAGVLAQLGARAPRLATAAGWFYTAAELAVILLVAEKVEHVVNEALDLRAARSEIADAGGEFLKAVNAAGVTPEGVAEAAQEYHEAWIAYRDFLYRPLEQDEALLAARMETMAREAKILSDRRKAVERRLAEAGPTLEPRLQDYLERLEREHEAKLQEDLDAALSVYNRDREKHLAAVYRENRRGRGLLEGVEDLDWHLDGAPAGAANDPYSESFPALAGVVGRRHAARRLVSSLGRVSENRLEAYDDEASVLSAVMERLRARGQDEFAEAIAGVHERVLRTRDLDRKLASGDTLIDTRDHEVTAGDAGGLLRGVGAASGR